MELNKEQKEAVLHEKGPLLIIAGAGTGKTRVITSRILHLLKSGKVKPEEFLALTFTEKATAEMMERIDKNLPFGYEEIFVKTFHAFSDYVLRQSGLEIGLDTNYKLLTDIDQWFFLRKHLFDFDLDYYRPLGNPNSFIYGLLQFFGRLKDELISPEEFLKFAEKQTGDNHEKYQELARAYEKYQELLLENNALDFADLTYYCLKLFNKRPGVLKEYQNRFKYIMVDEFQDTNYAQFALIMKIAENHRNIVVVGDDDQSIYKWRGASLSNILQFDQYFPENKKIVLLENYRNSRPVLDSAYKLINYNNPDRLEEKSSICKKLRANNEIDEPVEIHHFGNFLQECSFVAERIKELKLKDVDYKDIAVLVRTNNNANPFIDEFDYTSIPYQVKNSKGLLSLEEIKDLAAVVSFLANPYDDISLLRILKIDVFEISMNEINHLIKKANKDHLFGYLNSDESTLPGLQSKLQEVYDLLNSLQEFSKKNSVGMVLNEFLSRSDYLKYLTDKEDFEALENINQFAKEVSRFEKEHKNILIRDFADYISLLDEANASLNSQDSFERDAVQILTVHGAKGLEFDYVFLVNLVNHRFPTIKRRDAFKIPDELTKEILPEGDYHLQEERRLMYVAMTRAIKKLYITHSDRYEGKKSWKASPFLSELSEADSVKYKKHEETTDALARLKDFKKIDRPIFDLPPFKKNKLSYSQFDTFKSCPLKYNYRYLFKVPVPPAHAANFGTSVHNTLNEFYEQLKYSKSVSWELLEDIYLKNWIPFGYKSKAHELTRKKHGLKILKDFYNKNSDPWIIPAFLERPFNIKIGDYFINGRIDRIDKLEDGTFEVIDYKTGKNKNKSLKSDLQLSIYALACRDVFNLPISKLSLYFLEGNEKVSTTRDADNLNSLKSELLDTIKEMENSDFSATPGFHCSFCDFKLICPAV